MRVGLQVSADRGRYATKVEKLQADARWADEAGLDTVWTPQIPDEIDVMTAVTLIGSVTSRIEVGTSVVPIQPRHPVVLAQQALSNQAVCTGRFTLGLGVSHHWIIKDMLGLPYERQATTMRCYLDVLDAALKGPGLVEVDNELFTIRQPLDITDITPTPVMIAALGPVMLKMAGERAAGTILWLADERTISSHIVPQITKAARDAGRSAPRIMAGVPVCLCRDDEVEAAVERTNRTLSEVVASTQLRRVDGAWRGEDDRRRSDLWQRGGDGKAAVQLCGGGRDGPQRPHRADRRRPRPDKGVGGADAGVPGCGGAEPQEARLTHRIRTPLAQPGPPELSSRPGRWTTISPRCRRRCRRRRNPTSVRRHALARPVRATR